MNATTGFFRHLGNQRGGKVKLAIDTLCDEVERLNAEVARLRALLSRDGTAWGEHCAGLSDDLPICGDVVDSELRSDSVVDLICGLPNGHTGPCWRVEEQDNPSPLRNRILGRIATEPDRAPGTKADVLADAASNVRGTTTNERT